MSSNSVIEVEITWKGGDITKAIVHPQALASVATVKDGKAYFTLNNPAPITVDIKGQMDEKDTGPGYIGSAIHTVSLYCTTDNRF